MSKMPSPRGSSDTSSGDACQRAIAPGGNISSGPTGLSVSIPSPSFPWTRWITATGSVSVIYNAESSDHDIAVAGAVTGDLVIVSPTNMSLAASLTVYGWSGRVRASGIVTIRISKLNDPLVSNETIAFRVLVIGVT